LQCEVGGEEASGSVNLIWISEVTEKEKGDKKYLLENDEIYTNITKKR